MKTKNRKYIADKVLENLNDYISDVGWTMDIPTFYWKDPVTGDLHHTMTAFNIQLDRDLKTK